MAFTITSMASLLKHTPTALKPTLKPFVEKMEVGGFFADDAPVTKSKNWVIKLSKANYDLVIPQLSSFDPKKKTVSGKATCDVVIAAYRKVFLQWQKQCFVNIQVQGLRSTVGKVDLWILYLLL